jgi:DNA-binding MarR family transcriptional regulator
MIIVKYYIGVIMKKILSELICNAFGIQFDINELKERTGLPRYLSSGRNIFVADSDDISMVIVQLTDPVDSRVLSKEKSVYENAFNKPVVFLFDSLNKNYRNAYVKHHIPFIFVPTQLYIPFMGILFSKKFSGESYSNVKKLTPNAQLILLFLMYHKKAEYSKQQLSEELALDPVYVTRATKELSDLEMIVIRKEGRMAFVSRELPSKELFEKVKIFLSSPVSDVIYARNKKEMEDLPIASDDALSHIGMLNPPEIRTYACFKKNAALDVYERVEEPSWAEPDSISKIEVWNYDPNLLNTGKTVDIISLYCSLRNSNDARVTGEIEELLEDYKWLS